MHVAEDSRQANGGMEALTWAHDWASTSLGPPQAWPAALRTAVGIVLASSHPMFIWWGPELIQFYNDAYSKTMGPERHPAALGQPGRACWEEIWPTIGPQIESIMAGGPATWHEDQLVPVTRHGRREDVWWTYGYSAIPDDGRVGGVLVVCTDVTREHNAREELVALNERLAANVAERHLAIQQLRETDRRKDEFLAMLAHELRNPLAPISAAAQVLQLAADNPDRVRLASAIIGRQVDHMSRLVEDLLDISRVSRGEIALNRQPVDARAVVAAAVEQSRPWIDEHQQRFELLQPETPLLVYGDRKRLIQVLVNLLNNASRYTQPGGVLSLRVQADTYSVTIAVSDNGIGIDPRLLPHVFDLFTQAQRSVDRAQGGLGIGLSLVKRIVELHGGSVEAHSQGLHTGSEFRISVPRYIEPRCEPDATQSAPAPAMARQRALDILVVDDNPDAACTLALCLRDLGHAVVVESDPLRALARATGQPFDAYLLDIGLPQMDGIELARRLRLLERPMPALIVAITGYGQAAMRQQAMEAGFDHYFVKPVEPGALVDLLASRRWLRPAGHATLN